MQVNSNKDEVLIRTENNKLYRINNDRFNLNDEDCIQDNCISLSPDLTKAVLFSHNHKEKEKEDKLEIVDVPKRLTKKEENQGIKSN
jgi:hypothetical protein